jgi:prepilin-type N-terminal cleavage/methylation domain-containing protein
MSSSPVTIRRGVTLIELLIVIAILGILIGLAVPLVQFATADRQIREASRALNAHFVGAQARAAELQRPVGVWIERRPGIPGEAFDLYLAEAPPPYAGDTEFARCWTMRDPMNNRRGTAKFDTSSLLLFSPPMPSTPADNFVQVGDLIRFNYRGIYYRITDVRKPPVSEIDFVIPGPLPTVELPPDVAMGSSPGYPYQILRREIRSSAGSLQLPDTTTIDLTVSGLGLAGNEFFPNNAQPVVIMFSPTGGIDTVRVNGSANPPTGPVHLLIGSTEKVMQADPLAVAVGDTPEANLRDLSNLWLSINHRTGKIATAENAQAPVGPMVTIAQAIAAARDIIYTQE